MLNINEIFASIQGEGPFAGSPAVFVRLAGCDLKCSFCDTDHEQFVAQSEEQIVRIVKDLANNSLVVITGGEPFLQKLDLLVELLQDEHFHIQFETNGNWVPRVNADRLRACSIVCSPKRSWRDIRALDLLTMPVYWKILVADTDEEIDVPAASTDVVYLQPIVYGDWDSERSKEARRKAVQFCLQYGVNLSMQLHKMLEVR